MSLYAKWDAQNVVPQNYKADLLAYFRTYLNNPEGVRGAAVSTPFLKEVGPGERYVACVRFNPKRPSESVLEPRVPAGWILVLVIAVALLALARHIYYGTT